MIALSLCILAFYTLQFAWKVVASSGNTSYLDRMDKVTEYHLFALTGGAYCHLLKERSYLKSTPIRKGCWVVPLSRLPCEPRPG